MSENNSSLRSEIAHLRSEMRAEIRVLNTRIDAVGNQLNTRIDALGMQVNPEFPFSILRTIAPTPGSLSNGMFELGFESKGLSTAPQRPVLSRIGVKHPKPAFFRPNF
jgi:hypothetical protein